MTVTIIQGDCRDVLKTMDSSSVHCAVTSPPYFGLRDYGVAGQMGLEPTPDEFVAGMVGVFREVRRVLRDDGTLWVNIGDSYANDTKWGGSTSGKHVKALRGATGIGRRRTNTGLKSKDMMMIPARLALGLQADGWYLRQDIIWSKPNPMPESVTDRCTKAHEYLFLLSKSQVYHFDQDAITEAVSPNTHARLSQDAQAQIGFSRAHASGKTNGAMNAGDRKFDPGAGNKNNPSFDAAMAIMPERRNKRSVWTVATQSFREAHFATFPPALIEPCILAGCPEGGTVLDPFGGAGTTGLVADRLKRNATLIELNPEYAAMAKARIANDAGMFAT